MVRNREKGPEPSGSEEGENVNEEVNEEVNEADLEKEELGGEEILREVLLEMDTRDKLDRAEDEAYQEKEVREIHEENERIEDERHERDTEIASQEGAISYMLIKISEELDRMGWYSIKKFGKKKEKNAMEEQAKELIAKSLDYLEQFDIDDEYKEYLEKSLVERDQRSGQILRVGSYERILSGWHKDNRFDRRNYIDTIREVKQKIDEHWDNEGDYIDGEEHAEENLSWDLESKRLENQKKEAGKSLEGFGMAALEHGDVKTAIDAFIECELITNKEFAKKVAEKMRELIKSSKPEDRAKAIAAKKSLEKFFEGDSQEEREEE